MGKIMNEQEVYSRNAGFDLRQEYDANGRILYVGYAYPGTNDSESSWQIFKCAYDSSGRLTHRRYADATDNFIKSWNNRATYSFLDI